MGNQFGVVVRITDAQLADYDPDEDVVMVNPFEHQQLINPAMR